MNAIKKLHIHNATLECVGYNNNSYDNDYDDMSQVKENETRGKKVLLES